ncbi:F-box/kelch-repeat protein At3g06240-like [Rutidosis leptorrhynchoides]|uniref:F-box/kelch-repeat protein At3g06240-like n=1 Tax=Rutidosis leptorrhynchoides TaxID=125765 RepID=UPI003A99FA10
MHDDILNNILARLPGKSLLRFRCVLQHWNRLISDPSFMESRSRRMILLKHPTPFVVIDEKEAPSLNKIPSPFEEIITEYTKVSIVGTLKGIVILVVTDLCFRCHMYLYNPLTRASKLLDVMDPPSSKFRPFYTFGFGYGATTNDLKIFRFGDLDDPLWITCEVFDIKSSSWRGTSPKYPLKRNTHLWGEGIFLNDCLYWFISVIDFGILALDIKEMVFSNINLPSGKDATKLYYSCADDDDQYVGVILGSLNGCLCMIDKKTDIGFELWMMKEEQGGVKINNPWSKARTFTFGLEYNYYFDNFHPMCILANGKILLTDGSNQFVIFDTSNDSFETVLNTLTNHNDSIRLVVIIEFMRLRSVEYVESLLSPLDLFAV